MSELFLWGGLTMIQALPILGTGSIPFELIGAIFMVLGCIGLFIRTFKRKG